MSHEQIWAPWRLGYIRTSQDPVTAPDDHLTFLPGADRKCFVCRAVADSDDRKNLVAFRGQHTVVILNRFPYNNGHLLVCPLVHKPKLHDLSLDELVEAQQTITRYVGLIERLMNAEGFNVGLNLGRAAGAGVPGHLHWHVVPRWTGDTNFMAVLAGVDVIPQSLDALWELLTITDPK